MFQLIILLKQFLLPALLINIVHNNKHRIGHAISFIKCDIEGGEEFILQEILEFSLIHKCKVWMSFHLPWWTCKKITDFTELFKKFQVNIGSIDVCDYINSNPFGSILFEPL